MERIDIERDAIAKDSHKYHQMVRHHYLFIYFLLRYYCFFIRFYLLFVYLVVLKNGRKYYI